MSEKIPKLDSTSLCYRPCVCVCLCECGCAVTTPEPRLSSTAMRSSVSFLPNFKNSLVRGRVLYSSVLVPQGNEYNAGQ